MRSGEVKLDSKTLCAGIGLKSGVWWLRNGKNKLMRGKKMTEFLTTDGMSDNLEELIKN